MMEIINYHQFPTPTVICSPNHYQQLECWLYMLVLLTPLLSSIARLDSLDIAIPWVLSPATRHDHIGLCPLALYLVKSNRFLFYPLPVLTNYAQCHSKRIMAVPVFRKVHVTNFNKVYNHHLSDTWTILAILHIIIIFWYYELQIIKDSIVTIKGNLIMNWE